MTTSRLMNELRQRAAASPLSSAPHAERRATAKAPRQALVARHDPHPTKEPALLEKLKSATPAKVGVGRTGIRYRTQTLLQFLVDFSVAKAAVESQIPPDWAAQQGLLELHTAAEGPEQFLTRPDLGRQLAPSSLELLRSRCIQGPDVQIVVGDGLSATAVVQNAPPMVQVLSAQLTQQGLKLGTPLFVRHCRAKIIDVVGEVLSAQVGVILVGERPGLGTGDGMSAYLVWKPRLQRTDAEKQAISNIHRRGLLPEDAGQHAARIIEAIVRQQTSGVKLDLSGLPAAQSQRPRINQAHAEPLVGCGQSHGQKCPNGQCGRPGSVCGRSADRPCEASSH